LPARAATRSEAPITCKARVWLRPDSGGRSPERPQHRRPHPSSRWSRRNSCLGLARGCQPPGWPIPGPTSENQASIDRGASAPGQPFRGQAGSPSPEPTTSLVSSDAKGALRGAASDRLQTFSSESTCVAFGLHRFHPRVSFRSERQVTVVSIGLPIEGAPL